MIRSAFRLANLRSITTFAADQNNVRTAEFGVWDEVSIGKGCDHFTTGPGGFLQALTHGYCGAKPGDEVLTLHQPSLPEHADSLKLRRFAYLGSRLSLTVDRGGVSLVLEEEEGNVVGEAAATLEVKSGAAADFVPLVAGQERMFATGSTLVLRARQ